MDARKPTRLAATTVVVISTLFSVGIAADQQQLFIQLENYGRCIDAQENTAPIRSEEALIAANVECQQFIDAVGRIKPEAAIKLQEHMKTRLRERLKAL